MATSCGVSVAPVTHLVQAARGHTQTTGSALPTAVHCYRLTIAPASVADWDRTFSVNARGVFLCYKFAAERMIAQGKGGRIIGASSVYGKQGGKTPSTLELN